MKYLDNTGLAYFKDKLDTELATKQDSLVSGTNIKTINNESILGSGNISISSGVTSYNDLTDKPIYDASYVEFAEGSTITNEQYQELKDATINQNILNLNGKAATGYYNFGDIRIECTSGNQYSRFTVSKTDNNHTVSLAEIDLGYDSDIQDLYATKQNTLVSGTNIKTINGDSILGSGNISVATKQYVDNLNTYSTNETNTGKTWIDGKPIYRKVINFGALPNTTTKSVAHGLTNIDFITDIRILSKNPTYSYYISIPYTNKSNVTYQVEFYIDATNVVITSGDNKSGYTNTYVILEYTKTTN